MSDPTERLMVKSIAAPLKAVAKPLITPSAVAPPAQAENSKAVPAPFPFTHRFAVIVDGVSVKAVKADAALD